MKQKKVKRMVKATIKREDGTEHTLYAKDMIELFTMNTFQSEEANEVVEINAHTIGLQEMRQGKDIKRRMQNG